LALSAGQQGQSTLLVRHYIGPVGRPTGSVDPAGTTLHRPCRPANRVSRPCWYDTTSALSAGQQGQSTLLVRHYIGPVGRPTGSVNPAGTTLHQPCRPKGEVLTLTNPRGGHYFKLPLTHTDPIRPTRWSPDPNRPMRWAFFENWH